MSLELRGIRNEVVRNRSSERSNAQQFTHHFTGSTQACIAICTSQRERAHAGNTYTAATLTARGCPINVSIELRARPRECGQNAGDVQGAMEENYAQKSKN